MYGVAQLGHFDKGTVTKGIQKLAKHGYIRVETDEADKRYRLLYTTEKAVNHRTEYITLTLRLSFASPTCLIAHVFSISSNSLILRLLSISNNL